MALPLTGDTAADRLLTSDPFALLVGMLLDQQVPLEIAFAGPQKLHERLETFDAPTVASMDPVAFGAVFAEKPAVHRFPASMAKRVQELARIVVDDWGGDAAAIWQPGDPDDAEMLRRLETLPDSASRSPASSSPSSASRWALPARGGAKRPNHTAKRDRCGRSPTSSTSSSSRRCAPRRKPPRPRPKQSQE